jgi:uncharacterized protein DUF6843
MSMNSFVLSLKIACISLLFALGVGAQDQGTGLIRGTAVDENGSAMQGAMVNVRSAAAGLIQHTLIRYVTTDAAGHFSIDRLDWGKYEVFAKKEDSAYPNTYFSFYDSGGIPEATITPTSPTADVHIRLGPKAGVLTGSVTNAETGAPVNAGFKLIRAASPDNWFSTSQAPNYRVLLPSSTDVFLEVSAPGFKTWTLSHPLRLEPAAEMRLDIQLELSHDPSLHPSRFLVPDGYVGWLLLEYGAKDTEPVPVQDDVKLFRFPLNGALSTSSAGPERGAEDEYFYYSANGSLRAIPSEYRSGGGMIWGQYEGDRDGRPSQFGFFVGTEEQYEKFKIRKTHPGPIPPP